ncbi:hypothetical protein BKA62DRAFT_705414 [Auriculariales sp. MPI-PUGE-AT-0066]|nr:hypothetical protein BKA62DRAFT_705414 [Auriculariales sp. MPI-PUGE-AT-0066]
MNSPIFPHAVELVFIAAAVAVAAALVAVCAALLTVSVAGLGIATIKLQNCVSKNQADEDKENCPVVLSSTPAVDLTLRVGVRSILAPLPNAPLGNQDPVYYADSEALIFIQDSEDKENYAPDMSSGAVVDLVLRVCMPRKVFADLPVMPPPELEEIEKIYPTTNLHL